MLPSFDYGTYEKREISENVSHIAHFPKPSASPERQQSD
jgi:hypothetical protein